jgi:hypothetical protein
MTDAGSGSRLGTKPLLPYRRYEARELIDLITTPCSCHFPLQAILGSAPRPQLTRAYGQEPLCFPPGVQVQHIQQAISGMKNEFVLNFRIISWS